MAQLVKHPTPDLRVMKKKKGKEKKDRIIFKSIWKNKGPTIAKRPLKEKKRTGEISLLITKTLITESPSSRLCGIAKGTYTSMEQNREHINTSTQICPDNF